MNTIETILIANATGPTNIGDQAMLHVLLSMLKRNYKGAELIVHSSVPELYSDSIDAKIDHTLYSWAVLSTQNPFTRTKNMLNLIGMYILRRLGSTVSFGSEALQSLLADYDRADLIVFVGGGYLRSKIGVTQTLNALMQTSMILFAKSTKAPVVIAPMSFGPFAYEWLEQICAQTLKNIEVVAAREHFSFQKLQDYDVNNLLLTTDHALFLPKRHVSMPKRPRIGFTIRKWLPELQQERLEMSVAHALTTLAQEHDLDIHPIIQVDSPLHGEDDLQVTERVVEQLLHNGVRVLPLYRPKDLDDAIQTYGKLTALLGMRMHSNILAAIQHVPFVALSYEYKTEGICAALGMQKFSIPCDKVDTLNLTETLQDMYTHRDAVQRTLVKHLTKLQTKESKRWDDIFTRISTDLKGSALV